MDLYHAPVAVRLVTTTERCGSTASRNTATNGAAAASPRQPVRRLAEPATDAFVVAASNPRPSTTLPITYNTADAASITTTSAYGSGLSETSVTCLNTCTGVIV